MLGLTRPWPQEFACSWLQRTSSPHPIAGRCTGLSCTAGWEPIGLSFLQHFHIASWYIKVDFPQGIALVATNLVTLEHVVVQYCQAAIIISIRSIR